MKVFSWADICGAVPPSDSPRDMFARGTALTIGGFDGPHRGHDSLFSRVLAHADLIPGVVTFVRSPRAVRQVSSAQLYAGDVSTLRLRLAEFAKKGFAFAVVIDFSTDFGKLTGRKFLEILKTSCNMRFLAVGPDFRCGFRLDTGTDEIRKFADENGITAEVAEPYLVDGRRVSSSSIRAAIERGDFKLAEELLGAPFLLDCFGGQWRRTSEGFSIGRDALTQIIPPVGEYPVFILPDSGSEVCGILKVTDRLVSVMFAGENAEAGIKTVRFRLS